MRHKPMIFHFEDYISGKYTETLFDVFGISKTVKNFEKAKEILSFKTNTLGGYDLIDVLDKDLKEEKAIKKKLVQLCEDNWYAQRN